MNAAAPLKPYSYARGVTSWHPLAHDLPALAADVVDILGVPKRMLAADFRKMVENQDHPFPRDMSRNTRGMRLTRLLEHPVQVGDVLLRMETREKRHIYDKTQMLVTERAELPPAPAFVHALRESRERGEIEPRGVFARLDRLDHRLAIIEGLLRAGSLPSDVAHPSPQTGGVRAIASTPASQVPVAESNAPGEDPAPPIRPLHYTYIGRPIPHPLNVCRTEELEHNLGMVLRGLELPEIPRGTMSDVPSDDCAQRLARVMRELGAVTGTLAPRVESYVPAEADLGPVTVWHDLSGRVTRAGHVLDKIIWAHRELKISKWTHPDLRGIYQDLGT